MYYRSYEEYMRAILGYPGVVPNEVYNSPYNATQENYMIEERDYGTRNTKEIEALYPEIYTARNPALCNVWTKYGNEPITKETIDRMVAEVYNQIDFSNEIMVKINIDQRSSVPNNSSQNRKENERMRDNEDLQNRGKVDNVNKTEDKQIIREDRGVENRRPNNPLLRDLIRILILNQLINQRPPRPMPPPRPPYRPQPRAINYNDYLRY